MAVRSRPLASSAFEGKTTRRPGMCVKMLSPRLRVVDGAAGEIAADGRANDGGRGPGAVRAPAHQGQFIANLVHGRPDVIEELNLDHRLDAAQSVAHGPAYDVRFGERRIEDAIGAKLGLQARGELEDAALSLHFVERLHAAGVGHVFAVDHDALVAAHLVAQAMLMRSAMVCATGFWPSLPLRTRAARWQMRRGWDRDPQSRRAR